MVMLDTHEATTEEAAGVTEKNGIESVLVYVASITIEDSSIENANAALAVVLPVTPIAIAFTLDDELFAIAPAFAFVTANEPIGSTFIVIAVAAAGRESVLQLAAVAVAVFSSYS